MFEDYLTKLEKRTEDLLKIDGKLLERIADVEKKVDFIMETAKEKHHCERGIIVKSLKDIYDQENS